MVPLNQSGTLSEYQIHKDLNLPGHTQAKAAALQDAARTYCIVYTILDTQIIVCTF
jgi:hypothetical protein